MKDGSNTDRKITKFDLDKFLRKQWADRGYELGRKLINRIPLSVLM